MQRDKRVILYNKILKILEKYYEMYYDTKQVDNNYQLILGGTNYGICN